MSEHYRRPHILVLSDDPSLTTFLGEGLIVGGFWTSLIASGIQAIEVFRLRGFDLVLLDAALGDLGAIETIHRLREPTDSGRPRTDVPIIVVAESPNELDAASATAAGADGTIYPPIELEELIPALQAVIEDWRRRHPDRPWADEAAQAPRANATTSHSNQ